MSNLGCKIDTWYWAIRNFDLLSYMATIWTWSKCFLSSTVWPVPSTPDHVTWSVTLIMMVIIIKRLPLVHNRRPDCMRWPAFIKNETIFSFATGGKHSIIDVESSSKPTHINISIASPVIVVPSCLYKTYFLRWQCFEGKTNRIWDIAFEKGLFTREFRSDFRFYHSVIRNH